jgi:hypothetical protein
METRNIGIAIAALGVGSTLLRTALKRYEIELPRPIDGLLGFGGLILMVLAGLLLWKTFVQISGLTLPKDSVWPITFIYAVLVTVAVLGSVYISSGELPYFSGDWTPTRKSGWGIRPRVRVRELLESVSFIKDNYPKGRHPKIKIIATKQGKEVAEELVAFFRHCDCEIEINQDGGSYIFPATESFRGVRLKYRESMLGAGAYNPVAILADTPITEFFPETDAFNFIQIEIGDGPSWAWS